MQTRPHTPRNRQQGFSLLEMIVVLSILTLLAGLLVPYVSVTMRIERTEATLDYMENLERGLQSFGQDLLTYPDDLDSLLTNATGSARWQGPYVVHRFSSTGTATSGDVRTDAWSEDFVYTVLSPHQVRLRSKGDDRVAGTDDDLVKDLDLTPVLRGETRTREAALNDAIAAYNRDSLPDFPLPVAFDALRLRLITRGYLADTDWHATDAWGQPFLLDPPGAVPPMRIRSFHAEP